METQPWYKQFWPWFLIVLPCCAVSASIYTFYLASTSQFSLVSEDYYKEGKGINLDLTKIRLAKQMGLVFRIDQQPDVVEISQHGGDIIGTAITVRFHHATIANRDFEQRLTADGDGVYRLSADEALVGKWRIQIENYDGSWRLQGKATLPATQSVWIN